ncbi:hypothetical protein [Bacillus sp. FJAT-26390]|uniref:hypothetical protein n=1 Tax=Bacillus sp. FJAT-26390 TaxID=1743142 RepID=UPI000807D8CD|nr:hypothetical protein [Bacillus sp. FJAT-26390]OBZ10880.1 hypothetical protein A7975_17915 [Bacillus sp. FJAT-26390]
MRVVLGKVGKSRVLDEMMQKLNKNTTAYIDSVGVAALARNAEYIAFANDQEYVLKLLEHYKDIDEIENVVLELNTTMEFSNALLNLEKRIKKNFIVTVQDNSVKDILVFDMFLPE